VTTLYDGKVTGTNYYPGWDSEKYNLKVGGHVGLRRDYANPFDPRATGVFFNGKQIGWVPKASNHTIAKALDEYQSVEAVITKVNPAGSFEDRVHIRICARPENKMVGVDAPWRQAAAAMADTVDKAIYDTLIKEKETTMGTINAIIDKNKQTATSAAFMEAGRIANNQVAKVAAKQLPVMVRGYADTAVGKLLLANIANFAATKLRPNDQRLGKLTGAMMVQAYQEVLADFDIEAMIEDMLDNSSIKKALKTLDSGDEK
jgi:hypothetical protein